MRNVATAPSIVNVGMSILQTVEHKISHHELINRVCESTGKSYESVRGTLIKTRGGLLAVNGWNYSKSHFTRCSNRSEIGWNNDYRCEAKLANWEAVKEILPNRIQQMVTLGGRQGTCIKVLNPEHVISYDFQQDVIDDLLSKRPTNTVGVVGDIFSHESPVQVFNADLIGYMCGSLAANLERHASFGHQYIVLTIQGQRNFRNSGRWVTRARQVFTSDDPCLEALVDSLSGYELLLNRFYRRGKGCRNMRTTVWRCQ